jgi:hypothetical protein
MAEETARLTLAFVGDQEVHRNNARALLEDFVEGWLKQHRKGEVRVVLPDWDDPTDTMSDLDDWASTAGYAVSHGLPEEIVAVLQIEPDARLILVGDPNDDDTLYDVLEEAAKYRIQTRSLINGLEKVVFDDDELDDDLAGKEGFHEVDVETGDGWAEEEPDELSAEAQALLEAVDDVEDAPDDDAAPDLDMLAELADDGEIEAQHEIQSIASALDLDVSEAETWVDAVKAIRARTYDAAIHYEETGEDVLEPSVVIVAGDESVELVKEDLEELVEELASRETLTPTTTYTREELEAKSFDEVKAIGVECGVVPGRGMQHRVYVNKILQATGVETEAPKKKRAKKQKFDLLQGPVELADGPAEDDEVLAVKDGAATITSIRSEPDTVSLSTDVVKEMIDSLRRAADALEALV